MLLYLIDRFNLYCKNTKQSRVNGAIYSKVEYIFTDISSEIYNENVNELLLDNHKALVAVFFLHVASMTFNILFL